MKKNQQKLMMGIGGVLLIIVLVAGAAFAFSKRDKNEQVSDNAEPARRKIAEPVNVIPLEERPYLQIIPVDARNLQVKVIETKKAAQTAEYELEYQAGTLLQGAFGRLELDSLPASATLLLGSCSAGGACTYHTDIKGGSLIARFQGEENYSLKQEWRYFDNAGKEQLVASKDAKFQLEATALANQRFIIVYNTPGYPGEVNGTVVSDVYSLTSNGTITGTGELTLRATEEGDLTILGYDGESWQEFATTSDGKEATANVDLMEAYLVVKN